MLRGGAFFRGHSVDTKVYNGRDDSEDHSTSSELLLFESLHIIPTSGLWQVGRHVSCADILLDIIIFTVLHCVVSCDLQQPIILVTTIK